MIIMIMMIMIRLLSGTKFIKGARPRKSKYKKNFCLLPVIHHAGEIGASEDEKKEREKLWK